MPAKKKPALRVRWSDRARDWATERKRPLTVAALVAGVLATWPIIQFVLERFEAQEAKYQRVEAAKAEVARLREEIASNDKSYKRSDAWLIYGQQDMRALVLGKWVTDCAVVIETSRKASAIERAACAQYVEQWRQAQNRAEAARKSAQEMSR